VSYAFRLLNVSLLTSISLFISLEVSLPSITSLIVSILVSMYSYENVLPFMKSIFIFSFLSFSLKSISFMNHGDFMFNASSNNFLLFIFFTFFYLFLFWYFSIKVCCPLFLEGTD